MSDASTFDRSRAPAPGPVRPFRFPHVERALLDNGLSVLTAPHGRLPVVTAALVLEAGAAAEPAEKAGLAQLVAGALDAGTRARSADEVAWALERLGVEFNAEAHWDAAILSIVTPRDRLEPALELFAEIAREPAFRAEDVERLRDEQLADILQRQKEPGALAADRAPWFIFAPGVPYRRPLGGTYGSVEAIRVEDVRAFYRDWYAPRGASLLVVGDIDAATARTLAESRFGDWTGQPGSRPSFEVQPGVARATVFVVDRPGSVQSEIRIGDVGLERSHPDYVPLQVMNSLLGGAFTSRLNMSLRERHGFTYGVHSGFAFRRRPGPFLIQTAVATEVTARATEEILREVRRLRDEPVSEAEVAASRDYLAGTLPLELQTTEQLAGRLADLVVHDLPDDYFDRYRLQILAVTPADVQRVAREHLRPERFAIVVVGDAGAVVPSLESLGVGPVEVHQGPAQEPV
jgi:zinc protease